MKVAQFTFNAFQENTYVLYDNSLECVIVDPGCNNDEERKTLVKFIEDNSLKPTKLINTHCHIDHVLGNKFIAEKYGLTLEAHEGEVQVLDTCETVSKMYGIPYDGSPAIGSYIKEDIDYPFGESILKTIFTPGHSPASLSFYCEASKVLIAGDALFQGSIGRTDLPGGDYDTLIKNIKEKLLVLPADVIVYSGHGPSTTIGVEKQTNPFLT